MGLIKVYLEDMHMLKNTEKTMDKIVALCKGRGFIFAGSEIYGGLANTWAWPTPGTTVPSAWS